MAIGAESFLAILRPDGVVGIRNHIAVISTVACANVVAEAIASRVSGAVSCTHPYGCDQLGVDAELTVKLLAATGRHPNVGAVLIVGLGCEQIAASDLAARIKSCGKPVRYLVIQDAGGTSNSIQQGVVYCKYLQIEMRQQFRQGTATLAQLTIGLECGGSDFTSGLAANPVVGVVSDLLVKAGAKVVFGETTEILGAEHILIKRALSPEIGNFILRKVQSVEDAARRMKVDIRGAQPSPGNIAGGLSSIEEKSLGAICKVGSATIVGVLEYGDIPKSSGLYFMDTPGNDLICTAGLAAGGAQMVLFTTGRGTPMGFATIPVLKITANKETAVKMAENIDVDVSPVLSGEMALEEAGEYILGQVIAIAGGRLVAAEKLGHREFGLHRIGPTL